MPSEEELKIKKWKEKSDNYYKNINREQFIKDLEKAGFKVIDKKKDK